MALTFDEVLAGIKPRERTVRLVLDGSLLAARDSLAAQVTSARTDTSSLAGNPDLPGLLNQLADINEQIEQAAVPFRVRAISRNAYRKLVAEHPDQDRLWDVDSFPPALVAACSVDPVMSPQQVAQLVDTLTVGQFDEIFTACFRVCNDAEGVPFSAPGSESTPI